MTDRKHLRIVWDIDAYWSRIAPGYVAWKINNWRMMQERDDKKRAERAAKRAAHSSSSAGNPPGTSTPD